MEDYNFWTDLLTSYRASPDSIKAMWLMVPLLLAAGFFALTVALLPCRPGKNVPTPNGSPRSHCRR
jgi:hypothetical protein